MLRKTGTTWLLKNEQHEVPDQLSAAGVRKGMVLSTPFTPAPVRRPNTMGRGLRDSPTQGATPSANIAQVLWKSPLHANGRSQGTGLVARSHVQAYTLPMDKLATLIGRQLRQAAMPRCTLPRHCRPFHPSVSVVLYQHHGVPRNGAQHQHVYHLAGNQHHGVPP